MTKTLTTKQAIDLINNGDGINGLVLSDLETTKVSFKEAAALADHGFTVPVGNVNYSDEDISQDPEFDRVIWEGNYKPLNEVISIDSEDLSQQDVSATHLKLKLEQPVKDWIDREQIDLEALVSKLITDQYQTEQVLQKQNSSESANEGA